MASTQYNLDKDALVDNYLKLSLEHQHQNGLALFNDAQLGPGMTVLDYGCGTGNLTEAAAELVGPTGKVIAFDIAEKRISVARDNIAKKNEARLKAGQQPLTIDYHVADAFSITPLIPAGTTFDVIFCNSVLHWVHPDQRANAVTDLGKFLKPGGRFAIAGGSGDHPHMQDPKVVALSTWPFAEYPIEGAAQFVKRAELEKIFSDLGYANHVVHVKTGPMTFPSVQVYLDFADASSSGNFLHVDYLPEQYRQPALVAIVSSYKDMADPKDGSITFDSNVLFSIAVKA